jgi:hypothetical protein
VGRHVDEAHRLGDGDRGATARRFASRDVTVARSKVTGA